MWHYLLDLEPDLAVLQEVSGVPDVVSELYEVRSGRPIGKSCQPQPFQNVTLVRGSFDVQLTLKTAFPWATTELTSFAGNLLAWHVRLKNGPPVNVVNVYSPTWPVDRSRLNGIDTGAVRLTQNPDVWVGDLLWSSLESRPGLHEEYWIVAGDFNMSETFDSWPGGPRGNREYLDRMMDLGFTECLRTASGELTPTFRNPRDGKILHQMDHLFVTAKLASTLTACVTANHSDIFDAGLSDHLPITAEFSSIESS